MTIQSEDKGFGMEMFEMHQVAYKDVHRRSPNANLQHIQDLHNGFVYNVIHYILDILMFNYGISVENKYYVESIKINLFGQHFVKVCYHGSEPTAVFTISIHETSRAIYTCIAICKCCISSGLDYYFLLCMVIGILLLVLAHPWAR